MPWGYDHADDLCPGLDDRPPPDPALEHQRLHPHEHIVVDFALMFITSSCALSSWFLVPFFLASTVTEIVDATGFDDDDYENTSK